MKSRPFPLLALPLLLLGSCSVRTSTTMSTVYDVQLNVVSAGNIPLSEWQIIPPEYENYYGSYIKSYSYRFYHNGTVEFSATYGFRGAIEEYANNEKETGLYYATRLGPNQIITISLPGRTATLTWEPNPRDPTDDLVFRSWEKRVMDFGYVDDNHPAREGVDTYIVLMSQSISPRPI